MQKTIPFMHHLLEKGKLKPAIDREYSLEDISKAYEYVWQVRKRETLFLMFELTPESHFYKSVARRFTDCVKT